MEPGWKGCRCGVGKICRCYGDERIKTLADLSDRGNKDYMRGLKRAHLDAAAAKEVQPATKQDNAAKTAATKQDKKLRRQLKELQTAHARMHDNLVLLAQQSDARLEDQLLQIVDVNKRMDAVIHSNKHMQEQIDDLTGYIAPVSDDEQPAGTSVC